MDQSWFFWPHPPALLARLSPFCRKDLFYLVQNGPVNPVYRMNPFSGLRCRYCLPKSGRVGATNRWWLLGVLLVGFSRIGWAPCFNATTSTPSVGKAPYSVAVGGFNADSKPDLTTFILFIKQSNALL